MAGAGLVSLPLLLLLIIGAPMIAVRQFRRRCHRRHHGRDDRAVDIDAEADDQHAEAGAARADRSASPQN
ncbi:hypothetical protein [Bradyrhizobium sp. CCBAU 21360]|uniref:hypothetical protein n=1 Tax=Bradyrhizobium sp. CCBAU 21360 TaxID=1325081 RepID=UPI0023056BB5|nr:hypothetical protein [Bradyrhizobium sp. CCBAU 21360]